MAEDQRARKRRRYTSNIITIKVGRDLTAITAHEDRLLQSSDYFTAALSNNWREGQKREITLENEKLDTVLIYIDWLYNSPIPQDLPPSDPESWLELARLYVFGEYIQDARFCNAVISIILHHIDMKDTKGKRHCPSAKCIRIAYEGTAEGSPIQRLVTNLYADKACKKSFEHGKDYPGEFLLDVAAEFVERRGDPKKVRYLDVNEKWFKEI